MTINILVADDSATMRRIMELTFTGQDAKVVAVPSSDAAVQAASELQPDVVLADASMPGSDGYALAQTLRTTPGLEGTPVVLMASQKTPYDESKGRAAGVTDHIVKPFDTQQIIDRVREIASQPRSRAAAPAAAAPPPPPRASMPQSKSATVAFDGPPPPPPAPRASMPQPAARPAPAPALDPPPAAAAPRAAAPAAVATATGDLTQKLEGLGLSAAQVEAVTALSRDIVERVVWEVVPDLAETIIREEIKRLTS